MADKREETVAVSMTLVGCVSKSISADRAMGDPTRTQAVSGSQSKKIFEDANAEIKFFWPVSANR